MNFIIHLLTLFFVFFSSHSSAKNEEESSYPIEFSDFYIKQTGKVRLVVAGEIKDIEVVGTFNYDGINVSSDDANQKTIRNYLVNYINDKEVDIVIRELIDGINANPGCENIISDCVPNVLPNEVSYSFDFDNNTLKIFAGTSLITKQNNKEYLPSLRSGNGLVNNSTLYTQFSNEASTSFNFSNKTTIGLPVGFVELDTQARNAGDNFDVYSAVFDTEFGDKRIVFGYLNNTGRSFNTTDILNNNADYSAFNLQFGSSQNLLKGGAKGSQQLSFIAPQDGQIELYLGNRLLLSKSVSSGRQSISYSELPQGAYTVNLKLISAGTVLIDDMIQVVNNNNFILASGDVDYAFNAGVFDTKKFRHTTHDYFNDVHTTENDFKRGYLQAKSSWRLAEPVILYSGITTNVDEHYSQIGARYIYEDLFSADYFLGYFSTGDIYQSANIKFGRLSLSAKAFDLDYNTRNFTLSNQLYGTNPYKNFSISYSKPFFGGNGYLNYNNYSSKNYHGINNDNSIVIEKPSDYIYNINALNNVLNNALNNGSYSTISNENYNIGWSTNIYSGTLTLNSNYNSNSAYDEVKFGIYWSQRFGKSVAGGLSVMTNNKGSSQYNNSLSLNASNDNWYANHTVMASLLNDDNDDNFESSLSGTYYWQNDKATVNAYNYVNSKGLLISSGTLQSTQVVSADSISLTKSNGNAFASINLESDIPISKIRYNLYSDKYSKSGYISGSENTILDINPYDQVLFSLDDVNNVEILSPTESKFVYPGTVISIDNVIKSLDSQVFIVSDILGKPVSQIRCSGNGCRGVEPLSNDGVFRVKFQKGSTFTLTSERRQCVFDKDEPKKYINAVCLQGLYHADDNEITQADETEGTLGDIEGFAYIGYTLNMNTVDALEKVGLPFKSIFVGKTQYIYVKHSNSYSSVQLDVLESIGAKLIPNNIDIQTLFTGYFYHE